MDKIDSVFRIIVSKLSDDEIDILLKKIAKHRDTYLVKGRVKFSNISRKEQELFIKFYPYLSKDDLIKLFKNRTPEFIRKNAKRLGLKKSKIRISLEDITSRNIPSLYETISSATFEDSIKKLYKKYWLEMDKEAKYLSSLKKSR